MTSPLDLADLDFQPAELRAMGDAVLERVVAHLASLAEQPSCGDLDAEQLCRSLREPAPEAGSPLEPLLDALFDDYIPRSFTTPGPGYLAYIPGGGVFPAALADLISNTTNRFTGIWQSAPVLLQLEANALDWLREWMGLPSTTRGLFTTGGSMATFNAVACARERLLGAELRPGTVYVSSQAHHSVTKAARLAGIAADRVRTLPVDAAYRLRVDALASAVAADRAAGLRPFLVVSSAGTTNTGAVDPLDEIADYAAREGLWHHVDGAYGAFFQLVPELHATLSGLSRADSLTLDPHKGMFLPYGTGALLVRDGAALRALHSASAGYLPELQEQFYDPSQYGPDLSRDAPGLRVWLTLKLYGTARYRAALSEKHALAVWAAEQLAGVPGVVLDAPPALSLFAFHLEGPGLESLEQQNLATRRLMERVTARGAVMVSGAQVGERYLGRVCVLSFRTRRARLELGLQHLREECARLLAEAAPTGARHA